MVIKIYPGFEKSILEKNINGNNIPHGINLYELLGVEKTAAKAQIGKAFNNLILDEHPDKNNGVKSERLELLENAKAVLFNARDEYDCLLDNEEWLDKTNNRNFRDKIIKFLEDKIVFYDRYTLKKYDGTTKYLPVELQNWKNEIQNATLASYEEINSYANLLKETSGSCLEIDTVYGNRVGFRLSEIVESFSGLQSKTQFDQTYDKIIQKIHEEDDQNGTGDPNDRLKRQKVREMKELINFSLLTERGEDKEYENKILNAFAEEGKGLEEKIDNILKNVKNRIKKLFDKKQKDNKLDPIKKDYIKKLYRLDGWNELLESWEQNSLEEKINHISEEESSLFDSCIIYATKILMGGYVRKHRAGFWNKLEELTDLKKEDIFQDDGFIFVDDDGGKGKKGKKIGERYEYISNHYLYSKIEPKPISLDGSQFLKMKLFICYCHKEKLLDWNSLSMKLNNMGYDKDIDSGWTPSKQNNDLLKYKKNEAVEELKNQLKIYGVSDKENEVFGKNWQKRFEIEGDNNKKIIKIWEDFLERLYDYKIEKNPRPWKGGENLSPSDPLKEEKEKAIAKILIKQSKKDENWNNYQNLKNLLQKIKELQFSDLYKKNKLEIHAIEKRIKELNLEKFNNSIKDDLNEKIKNNGLSQEEISNNTQKLIDEAIESKDSKKREKAEEAIIQEGTDKKLDIVITIIAKAIKKGDLTNDQKEECITKILECISENEFQKKAYQKNQNKVDKLLSKLRGETTKGQEDSEVSWPKKIGIAGIISLIITILVSVAMKVSAHRKRRNPQ